VLALAAGSKNAVIDMLGLKMIKLPLDLQKSLDDIDETKLGPYKVLSKSKIENKDVLESLGTDDYIKWFLEDTEASASSPVRFCSLFITYYTGDPDRVPHVPEECYAGSGGTILSRKILTLNLDLGEAYVEGLDVKEGKADFDVRHLVFMNEGRNVWELEHKYAVLYFFKVNGAFAASRGGTRAVMGENFFGTYSYFSKVEWRFCGQGSGATVNAKEADTRKASEKLISVLLPILEKEHWPDWEKANADKDDDQSTDAKEPEVEEKK
jgi:hypothetical protein